MADAIGLEFLAPVAPRKIAAFQDGSMPEPTEPTSHRPMPQLSRLVQVKVDALQAQAAQHVQAQPEQHRADNHFQDLLDLRRNRPAQAQDQAAERHQGQGVAQPPGGTLS